MRPTRPPLLILIVVAATGPTALNILVPSLPAISASLRVSYGTVQLALTLYLVAIAVAQLFVGSLSDRLGRRPVLLGGLVLLVLGSMICAFAADIVTLLAGRVVQAVGGCTGIVLSRAIARDISDHSGATRMVAHITMAMVVVPMVAPAAGGYLEEWFDWRAGFYLVAVIGLLALAGSWQLLHETHFKRRAMPGITGLARDYAQLLRSRCFCGFAFNAAFSSAMFFAFLAGAPYIMVQILDRPPSEYGLYFMLVALGYMCGNFVAARLSARVRANTVVLVGSLLGIVGTGLLGVLAAMDVLAPWALFGPMVVITFSNGLNLPNAMMGAVSVDPAMAGTASGLAGFVQMSTGALATIVVGELQGQTAVPMILVMASCAVAALGAAILALVNPRRDPGRAC
jgi:DHA1 family bicyclomycin/chloramphenicol resistance-like MFS transporter